MPIMWLVSFTLLLTFYVTMTLSKLMKEYNLHMERNAMF